MKAGGLTRTLLDVMFGSQLIELTILCVYLHHEHIH